MFLGVEIGCSFLPLEGLDLEVEPCPRGWLDIVPEGD